MSPEDYSATERRLRELVVLRNELVHHFIERFDLWTLDGGQTASEFLDASLATRVSTRTSFACEAGPKQWTKPGCSLPDFLLVMTSSGCSWRTFNPAMACRYRRFRSSNYCGRLQSLRLRMDGRTWTTITTSAPDESPAKCAVPCPDPKAAAVVATAESRYGKYRSGRSRS